VVRRHRHVNYSIWDWAHEVFVAGLCRLFLFWYTILSHIAIVLLWPTGIRIAYINDEAWPYKRVWKEFKQPNWHNIQ
jgi:hypothetical protein